MNSFRVFGRVIVFSLAAILRRLRPILATFLVAYAALAVNSYAYFFLPPVIVESLIAVCLGSAIVTAKSQASTYAGTAQRA